MQKLAYTMCNTDTHRETQSCTHMHISALYKTAVCQNFVGERHSKYFPRFWKNKKRYYFINVGIRHELKY